MTAPHKRIDDKHYTDFERLEHHWQTGPEPVVPWVEKERQRLASLSPGQRRAYLETQERLRQRREPYYRLIERLRTRCMTVRQIEELTGITKRQLSSWESLYVRAWTQVTSEGWRRFSIKDAINLAIIKAINAKIGIPLKRFAGEITDWIQQAQAVESLILPFSRGSQIYIGFVGGMARFWDEDTYDQIRAFSNSAFFVLPLREAFESVLKGAKRDDFEAKSLDDGSWRFRLDSAWVDLAHLVRSNKVVRKN